MRAQIDAYVTQPISELAAGGHQHAIESALADGRLGRTRAEMTP